MGELSRRTQARAPGGPGLRYRVAFTTRLFVWSAILEPMFFFVMFEESTLGVTGNLSRLLQLTTLALLAGAAAYRLLSPRPVEFVPPTVRPPLYRNYVALLALAMIAGIIGYSRGAYTLPTSYDATLVNRSALSTLLNSEKTRPLFEYVTAAYYFGYFVVLPQYLIRTRTDVDYALARFKTMFVLSFVLGAIDLAIAMTTTGRSLLPRHLGDPAIVEARFHGLAGEPRQAFVYLCLGLALFHLMAFRNGRKLDRGWTAAIIAAALLTQSTTGLVAVAMFGALYGLYAMSGLTFKRLVQLAAALLLLVSSAYGAAAASPRTMAYFREASGLWDTLEAGEELPYLMSKSNSDIYPLYDLTVKARQGDWLPVAIGSGFGSASAVTNRYYRQWSELNNPHSQLARSLYETGLIGLLLYVMSFARPVKALTARLPRSTQRNFMLFTLLLVACSLADRSSVPFIYLGLAAAAAGVGWRAPALEPAPAVAA